MAEYGFQEKLLTCPFNKSHQIRASRFQTHIIKCQQDNKNKAYVNCPFNATHLVHSCELHYHVETCSDRKNHSDLYNNNQGGELFMQPPIFTGTIKGNENWDESNYPTYNPNDNNNLVLRQASGLKRNERRQFRMLQRRKFQTRRQDYEDGDYSSEASLSPKYYRHGGESDENWKPDGVFLEPESNADLASCQKMESLNIEETSGNLYEEGATGQGENPSISSFNTFSHTSSNNFFQVEGNSNNDISTITTNQGSSNEWEWEPYILRRVEKMKLIEKRKQAERKTSSSTKKTFTVMDLKKRLSEIYRKSPKKE